MMELALDAPLLGARRQWLTPTIDVYSVLASLAAQSGTLPNLAAILQINVSCQRGTPACGP
jgi:hypothetical protein